MAKANFTAMEKLFTLIEHSRMSDDQILRVIKESKKDLIRSEREQIQTAFINGTNGSYTDSQHYYFMEYIDND